MLSCNNTLSTDLMQLRFIFNANFINQPIIIIQVYSAFNGYFKKRDTIKDKAMDCFMVSKEQNQITILLILEVCHFEFPNFLPQSIDIQSLNKNLGQTQHTHYCYLHWQYIFYLKKRRIHNSVSHYVIFGYSEQRDSWAYGCLTIFQIYLMRYDKSFKA